jgi:hypothetical protein
MKAKIIPLSGFALLICVLMSFSEIANAQTASPSYIASRTTNVWLQVMDSCKEGLAGANFVLVTPTGAIVHAGPSMGTGRKTVTGGGQCPLQRGNCTTVTTGCLNLPVAIPVSGIATYTIRADPVLVPADGFFENPRGATPMSGFVPCNGGSACHSESATFTIDASGNIRGSTTNIYPDGAISRYPTVNGTLGSFAGTQTDPIVFHNFQLGNISCDGDNDADDHLTGTPSAHCDSDKVGGVRH